jgi:hypothetical protein
MICFLRAGNNCPKQGIANIAFIAMFIRENFTLYLNGGIFAILKAATLLNDRFGQMLHACITLILESVAV